MKTKFASLAAVASFSALSPAYAANLVSNGSFEAGNTGFWSDLTYQSNLGPAGTYYVGSNPNDYHPGFSSFAAQDGAQMMIINADTRAGVTWGQNGISVSPHTTYYFSGWIASVYPDSPAVLSVAVNGNALGTHTATLDGKWSQFSLAWDSGSNSTANLTIVNLNLALGGNDLAMDNIEFYTTAVPEPETYAMMLAGLGVLGAVARRRKTQ